MYYGEDLAFVHDRGFGDHADRCAPGVLQLLAPVLDRDGTVLELGCGSGRLTGHLVGAGHRVVATDSSEAMLRLARAAVPGAVVERLVLPDDPLPPADAIVSVGHVLSYLRGAGEVDRALTAIADALIPGGVVALDLCDRAWGRHRRDAPDHARVDDGWAIITRFEVPSPDLFVRRITTFVRGEDGSWRRDDERHDNVLIDTSRVPTLLGERGVVAEVRAGFGSESLPSGLVAIVGTKPC